MKIKKLYTLSQFVDFLDESSQDKLTAKLGKSKPAYNYAVLKIESYEAIIKYNDFLKGSPKKEMFINELEKPDIAYQNKLTEISEKKVIFKGKHIIYNGETTEYEHENVSIFKYSSTSDLLIKPNGVSGIWLSNITTLHDLAEATNGEIETINLEI